jgi:GH25 family lysozyme M1 (1,4-beta-N-acetylmuramidase)
MPKFSDNAGREWNVSLNVGLARQVYAAHGVDLLDESSSTELPGLLLRKLKLAGILWELVATQATAAGVTQDSFFNAMDSAALAAGYGALVDAFVSFCQPASQDAVRRVVEAQTEALAESGRRMAALASGPEATAAIARIVDQATAEVKAELQAIAN